MNNNEMKTNAKSQIDSMFKEMEELDKKKDKLQGEAKQKVEKGLQDLRKEKDKLEKEYKQLQDAGDDKMDNAKNKFKSASEDFKSGLKKLTQMF